MNVFLIGDIYDIEILVLIGTVIVFSVGDIYNAINVFSIGDSYNLVEFSTVRNQIVHISGSLNRFLFHLTLQP